MNKLFKIVFLISFTIVLAFIFINFLTGSSDNHDTYEAEMGELKYEMKNKGYLIYKEDIIGAPFDGEIEYLVNDGQRVVGKTPIAKIKKRNVSSNRDLEFDGKDFLIDVDNLKKNIKTIENQIAFFRKEKNIEAEERAKKILENLYPVLASLDGRNDLFYNKPIETYTKESSNGYVTIFSNNSGLISLKTTPYDQIFTPDNMYILRYDKLKDDEKTEIKKEAKQGEGFIRVVDNSQVFLFTNVDKKESDIFSKDRRIDIMINGTLVKGVLLNKITNADDVTLQFLLMNDFKNMVNKKVVDVTLIPAQEKGIVIDESSIIDYKGNEGVEVLNKDNTVVFKRINRLTTVNGKVCISVDTFNYYDKDRNIVNVTTVKLYDDIIRNPQEEFLVEE